MTNRWHWFFVLVVALALLAASCAAPSTLPAMPATSTSALTATTQPATVTSMPTAATHLATWTPAPTVSTQSANVTRTASSPSPLATSTSQLGTVDLDKILPPGKPRDLLLGYCDSCHPWACSVVGQREVDVWETIKVGMRVKVPNISDDDLNAVFAYLEANFNDKKPAPELPPEFANPACGTVGE